MSIVRKPTEKFDYGKIIELFFYNRVILRYENSNILDEEIKRIDCRWDNHKFEFMIARNEKINVLIEKIKKEKENIQKYIKNKENGNQSLNAFNTIFKEVNDDEIKLVTYIYILIIEASYFLKETKSIFTISACKYTRCTVNKEDNLNEYYKYNKLFKGEGKINLKIMKENYKMYYENEGLREIKIEDQPDNFNIEIGRNILFKGVPGTGKSRAVNKIIEKFNVKQDERDRVLRIGVHESLNNNELIQGISIGTKENNIIYKEKKGVILNFIYEAILNPTKAYFLILEEIQENSLNELLGELIYLIEEEKRVDVQKLKWAKEKLEIQAHINCIIMENKISDSYIELPYLIEESIERKKIFIPKNLYIFCTANYREDKKIIEDNLYRRFEVINIYPDEKAIEDQDIKEIFIEINKNILNVVQEIHKDRYLIGHSNWIKIGNVKELYKVIVKLFNEFKEIRELEFETMQEIFEKIKIENKNKYFEEIENIKNKILKSTSYFEIEKSIRSEQKIYGDIEEIWS